MATEIGTIQPVEIELAPETVLAAYRHGIFPMAEGRNGPVGWYVPVRRGILPLHAFHVSRNLVRLIRSQRFEITADRDFTGVIEGCAQRDPTWISHELQRTYEALHASGHVHCVEAYREGTLVGGIYGVHIGAAFMGESMFHRLSDAGKVCLVALVEHLRKREIELFDIQEITPVTARFGGIYISQAGYVRRLQQLVRQPRTWGTFTF